MKRSLDIEDQADQNRWRLLRQKFYCAFRGAACVLRRDYNFAFHLVAAVVVIAVAGLLRASLVEWCLLGLCIVTVLVAETFNTSIETLAQAISPDHDPHLKDALDIAAASVLLAAIGASVVGAAIFIRLAGAAIGWW